MQLFVRNRLGVPDGSYRVDHSYRTKSMRVTHFYLKQVIDGIPVSNGDLSLNVADDGRVVAFFNTFANLNASFSRWRMNNTVGNTTFLGARDALVKFAEHAKLDLGDISTIHEKSALHNDTAVTLDLAPVPFADRPVRAKQAYLRLSDNGVAPVWALRVKLPHNDYHIHVNAVDGRILRLVDWVSRATYRVLPIKESDPITAKRQLFVNPVSPRASPNGWLIANPLQPGKRQTYTTRGNNVEARAQPRRNDPTSIRMPVTDANQQFDFPLDLSKPPEKNTDASVTNLFYVVNTMHDVFYLYGFTEIAGNFQKDNLGRGGKGGDAVLAVTLDEAIYNNSEFEAGADGEPATLRLYRYTKTQPHRDGALDNGLIVHEYTHGLSTRLVGGPSTGNCMTLLGPAGINEGTSDFVAMWTQIQAHDTRARAFELSLYSYGSNVRPYPYSTNMKVNPVTFDYFNNDAWAENHKLGVIWSSILYEIYWNLVDKLGFDSNTRSVSLARGNTLMLKLLVSALKLIPCEESFITARNAFLQAEKQLTGGAHQCALWRGFAKRGLGMGAKLNGQRDVVTIDGALTLVDNVIADFAAPSHCTGS
ncbi:Fungalysin metallopeptidase-domain-containing protein [Thamnocephalis sphaerospora]|uniref:Extracellular metalloproteinase n=1 Tax=Thamnocephalis sphaerospora TaxID=78915 RepID=A0A4P9XNW2_9FUNG|nr:Fungalysin metallopeptidase-domain-containing protein [Thamnocephalis sphaerospora]|eukprot:RKP07645.1 Fungalysin metallopeptidase-domain-containing protein [Thamnocephalis sphaerospora]